MKKQKTKVSTNRISVRDAIISILFIVCVSAVGLFVLLKLAVVIKSFVSWIADSVSHLDAVIIVALITGTVSIVGVVLSSIISKVIEYKQNRRDYLSKKREEPYSDFVDMLYKMLEKSKKNELYSEDEMIADINKFSKKLTLWGSNDVIRKWLKFRKSPFSDQEQGNVLFIMEDILYAMRKDLGLRKMRKGNLLSFFVNDLENVNQQKNRQK